jgi:hypothetical protein
MSGQSSQVNINTFYRSYLEQLSKVSKDANLEGLLKVNEQIIQLFANNKDYSSQLSELLTLFASASESNFTETLLSLVKTAYEQDVVMKNEIKKRKILVHTQLSEFFESKELRKMLETRQTLLPSEIKSVAQAMFWDDDYTKKVSTCYYSLRAIVLPHQVFDSHVKVVPHDSVYITLKEIDIFLTTITSYENCNGYNLVDFSNFYSILFSYNENKTKGDFDKYNLLNQKTLMMVQDFVLSGLYSTMLDFYRENEIPYKYYFHTLDCYSDNLIHYSSGEGERSTVLKTLDFTNQNEVHSVFLHLEYADINPTNICVSNKKHILHYLVELNVETGLSLFETFFEIFDDKVKLVEIMNSKKVNIIQYCLQNNRQDLIQCMTQKYGLQVVEYLMTLTKMA